MVPLNKTYYILTEGDDKVLRTRNDLSIVNRFTTKPQGVIVQDSYNNPFFPIQPKPRLDTYKCDLLEVYRRFHELYENESSLFLPWHFCIEMIEDKYVIFNTRPIDQKFPLTNLEAISRTPSQNWDENTQNFIKNNIFDISESIHVCIIGDTNLDVYTKSFYQLLSRSCILPVITQNKLPGGLEQRIFLLNIGIHFNKNMAIKFVRT